LITLPQRRGERPETHYGLPHEQLSQNAPPDMYDRLKGQAWGFEFVERRPSVVSVPGAEALWLADEGGAGCAEAFLAGKEFAHVHPPYDGSLHMRLPLDQVQDLLERGWGEHHPLVPAGKMAPNSVMVYGPRDPDELSIVMSLIEESYAFARGL
jgi:phospholipase/carboxylesterase